MVNEEIISPLPRLYLYLSFLIIVTTTTTIPLSLTLKFLYPLNLPPAPPFFHSLRNTIRYSLTFLPNPFTLHSPVSSFALLFPRLFPSFPFGGFLISSVRPYRISGLAEESFWQN